MDPVGERQHSKNQDVNAHGRDKKLPDIGVRTRPTNLRHVHAIDRTDERDRYKAIDDISAPAHLGQGRSDDLQIREAIRKGVCPGISLPLSYRRHLPPLFPQEIRLLKQMLEILLQPGLRILRQRRVREPQSPS